MKKVQLIPTSPKTKDAKRGAAGPPQSDANAADQKASAMAKRSRRTCRNQVLLARQSAITVKTL